MDSLTQATLGALCGELLLRKQLGWKGAAWGFFFGTLPDLDIIMSPWLDAMDSLRNHRSLSHSIFLMLLMSPVFGLLLAKLHKHISVKRASAFVLLTWFTHVFIDCFNSYGTQIFEPFSDYRVTLNNISIIDPLFTLPMLVGVIWALCINRESEKRSRIVAITTAWITFYTCVSFLFQSLAQRQFESQLTEAGITADDTITSNTLGNIFLWRMIARDENHFYVSYWSIWDSKDRPTSIDAIPRNPELAAPFKDSKAFETLDWFSQGWWKITPMSENSVALVDLRFAEMHQIDEGNSRKIPPFIWQLSLDEDGSVKESRASVKGDFKPKKTLKELGQRIIGRSPDWMTPDWPWESTKTLSPENETERVN